MSAHSSFRTFLLAAVVLSTTALAQQRVCMSLHAGPATGTNSTGAPAQVAGRVNGVQVSVPTSAGQTAAAASAAHQAAFAAAGFTTVRPGVPPDPNVFCVIAGPGGVPITSGLCYGTDDMGFNLDSSVALIPPVPPGGAAAPAGKPGGVVVPLPGAQQPPQPFTGTIQICFDVWVNGVRVRICITIQLQMLPGSALQQSIEQQLQQNGFLTNRIVAIDPLRPTQFIDALQIERMAGGQLVDGVEYQYDALSRRIVPNVSGAGLLPVSGTAEYGVGTRGPGTREPWSHATGSTRLGSFFDIFHEVELPQHPGAFVIGFGPASLPFLNGTLLVDPNGVEFEFAFSDQNGTMQHRWNVPVDPRLIGVQLHEQAGVVDANFDAVMSTGMRAVVGG